MRRMLGFVLCFTVGFGASAQAATIGINAGVGLAGNAAALAAFNRAASTLGLLLTDDVQVVIDADLQNLGNPNIIGQAQTVLLAASYSLIRDAVVADAADEADDDIVASLPTAAQFSAFLPAGFSLNGGIYATKANLKALGFTGLDAIAGTATDSAITFNSTFAFDFDNSDGVGAGLIDFESVALHELGHALGFISAVDDVDFLVGLGQTSSVFLSVLDLFRFGSANVPTTPAEFTINPRMLAPGASAYTSDVANAWGMSTGFFSGDGRQASHWKDDGLTGIHVGAMDPTLAFAVSFGLTPADLRAFDLIGWEVASQSDPAPEPTSMILLGSGLAAGLFRRKRRARPVD